jgi:hypothetical protein
MNGRGWWKVGTADKNQTSAAETIAPCVKTIRKLSRLIDSNDDAREQQTSEHKNLVSSLYSIASVAHIDNNSVYSSQSKRQPSTMAMLTNQSDLQRRVHFDEKPSVSVVECLKEEERENIWYTVRMAGALQLSMNFRSHFSNFCLLLSSCSQKNLRIFGHNVTNVKIAHRRKRMHQLVHAHYQRTEEKDGSTFTEF